MLDAGVGLASNPIILLIFAAREQACGMGYWAAIRAATIPVRLSPVPPIGSMDSTQGSPTLSRTPSRDAITSQLPLTNRYRDGTAKGHWRSSGLRHAVLGHRKSRWLLTLIAMLAAVFSDAVGLYEPVLFCGG